MMQDWEQGKSVAFERVDLCEYCKRTDKCLKLLLNKLSFKCGKKLRIFTAGVAEV